MTDLLGEQIDYAVTDMATGQALVNTGKLKASAEPEIKARIAGFAAEVTPSNPGQLGVFVKDQLASWGRRIKDAGIEPA